MRVASRVMAERLSTPLPALVAAALAGMLAAVQPVYVGALVAGGALMVFAALTPLSTLAALLILAPLRTLLETEAPLRLPLDIGQIFVLLLALSWFVVRVARGQRVVRWVPSQMFIPFGVFLGAVGLSAINAYSTSAWITESLKWVIMLVLIVLALNLGQHWPWLVFALVAAGAANAIIGVYIYFGGSGADHLLISPGRFRAFGTFGQPNPFGGFMGLLAPLAFGVMAGYGRRLWGDWRAAQRSNALAPFAFYAAAFVLISAGCVLSWSRGSWLALVLALALTVVAMPRKRWHSAAVLLFLAGMGGTVWISGILPGSIQERIASATQELFDVGDVRGVDVTPLNYAVVERLAHWQAALEMARAHPWTGVGFGSYEVAYPQFRLLYWEEALGHAHNYYLNVVAETGIIGLAAYLTLWAGILWLTVRARRHPDVLARLTAAGLLGTWTYLGVHSLTDNLYVNNMFLHIGVMLGVVAVLHRQTWSYLEAE